MTASIPLSALPQVDTTRRDQYGRYLVLPPGAEKPVGYTRVTTVAKTLDDGGGLAPWKATMTACGMLMRRGLRAQWEALMAATGGDPWYASDASKAEAKKLVKECSAVGGANDRREIGTALHRIAALMAQGHFPEHLSEETEADLRAYLDGLAGAGITIISDLIEVTVVLDDWKVAGTFDLGVNVPGFAKPLVADLKTGADLQYSWQTIACQLAAYSRGVSRYKQGPAEDGSQDVRLPMPDFDQDNGLIAWLPAGQGELELHFVDLNAGWEAFEHSMWTRQWRKRDVSMPFAQGGFNRLTEQLEASVRSSQVLDTKPIDEYRPEADDYVTQLRAWLQSRINAIGKHVPARTQLMQSWPEGVPSLPRSTDHTMAQLDAIDRLCWQIEKQHKLTFPPDRPEPPEDPEGEAVARVLRIFPNTTIITNTEDST